MHIMSANESYVIRRCPPGVSEKSDSVMRAIRAALVADGTSFRGWVYRWAKTTGRSPAAAYQTARSTINRRLERGLAPAGSEGQAITEALRRELGAHVVPYPRHQPTPDRPRKGRGRRSTPAGVPAAPEDCKR